MSKIATIICIAMLCGIAWSIPENMEMIEQTGIQTNNNLTESPSTPSQPKLLTSFTNGVLMIPDWTTDSIGLFDPYNGAFLKFISRAPSPQSGKNAIQGPDGNIYLSDQAGDAVYIFDTLGTYLGVYADASDGLDNVRGIAFRDDHLFVCSYNGTSTLRAVKEFSGPHTYVRDFIANYTGIDPYDIHFLPDGRALFSDAGNTDQICLYDTNGVFLSQVYYHGASRWPQQIQSDSVLPGTFLGALWDADTIIDFDLSGTVFATCTLKYVKGVYRLGNGNILATCNQGIYDINPSTGSYTQLSSGTSWQYIELYRAHSTTPTCTVNVNTHGNGTIIPSGMVIVNQGSDTVFSIVPDIGEHLDSLIIDGTNHGADSTSFRFINVMTNHTMTGYFSVPVTHNITATAIDGGTIIPSGSVTIAEGTDTTFAIAPDANRHLDSLIVDGVDNGTDSTSFQFINVLTDHSITAYFSINTFTINATTTSGGTIAPSGIITVNYGDDTTFTIAANTNYVLDSVMVDGASVGAVTSYPFTDVTANHTIHAMFTMTAIPGWTQQESLPTQVAEKYVKDGGSLVGINGTKDDGWLYAFRGNKSKEFYVYNGTWRLKESLPYGYKPSITPPAINKKQIAKGASMCYDPDNNIIYATKGNGTKEFWAYNISESTWTAKAFVDVPKGLKGGTSIVYLNGKVYLLAGNQKKTDLNNFFCYNPTLDVWSPRSNLTIGPNIKPFKDGSCITVLNGDIHVIKGGDKGNYCYKYDTTLLTWSSSDSMPLWDSLYGKYKKKLLVKDGAAMTNDGSVIYVVKGGGTNVLWQYTPGVKGTWTRLDSVPRLHKKSVIKTGGAMAYANGAIWLFKGNNSPEFWKYVPVANAKVKSQKSKVTQSVIAPSASDPEAISNNSNLVYISPNPFTNLTTIQYIVPISGKVSLRLYNTTGKLVETLINEYANVGSHTLAIDNWTLKIPRGIYFLRYETVNYRTELKLIVQ